MTHKQQRHPDGGGAGKAVLLKQNSSDHTGNPSSHQQSIRGVRMPTADAEAKFWNALDGVGKGRVIGDAVTFRGTVIATFIDDGLLTVGIEVGKKLPIGLVIPIASKNVGVQQAGRELLAKIFRAAECNAKKDSDELIGCEIAVTVSAGGQA